jgi:hypothetical protein
MKIIAVSKLNVNFVGIIKNTKYLHLRRFSNDDELYFYATTLNKMKK